MPVFALFWEKLSSMFIFFSKGYSLGIFEKNWNFVEQQGCRLRLYIRSGTSIACEKGVSFG